MNRSSVTKDFKKTFKKPKKDVMKNLYILKGGKFF